MISPSENDRYVSHSSEPMLQGPGAAFSVGGGLTLVNEHFTLRDRRLGRLPSKSSPRALHFADFASIPEALPERFNFWARRAPFPIRSFGNLNYGDCTRAKQAVAAIRMERIEQRRTTEISDDEVIRVYVEMSDRLYGGGDNGAYETDALDCWRRPEYTFRDYKGRALTIDAYTRLNPYNHHEMRGAIWTAGAKGIAICLNLPLAFQRVLPPADWDLPEGQPLTGVYMPGGWGGHSMWSYAYDEIGFWLDHTWDLPPQRITYRAAAAYLDEAHLVIDSANAWRKALAQAKRTELLDVGGIVDAVNAISSHRVAA
jgi:hypothetical protein